jgi:predicted transcriptional regulator
VPVDLLDSVIIINSDDSAFGTAWLISSEIKSNKESYPSSIFINDGNSTVAETWGLPLKSVTSLIIAANGEILFRKDGETTAEDVATVMAILKDNLPEFDIKPTAVVNTVD